jgi:uncharacterized protein (TIGR02722 family)
MKKQLVLMIGAALSIALLGSCASTQVARVGANTEIDLSGNWNDTDVRLVCTNLIKQILASPNVKKRSAQWRTDHNGDNPSVVLGAFRNKSSEHLDTSIVSRMMQTAIINSGELDFVAGGAQRAAVEQELDAQNGPNSQVSQDTAAQMGQAQGATYILLGTVNSMVDRSGNKQVRTYFVDAQLINVQSQKIIWQGEDDSIKKLITQAKASL